MPLYSLPAVSACKTTPMLRAALALLLGLPIAAASAGTFTWNNLTGNWSDGTKWVGNVAPTGANSTDILVFGGDVGTTAGVAPNYTATENLAGTPFVLNQLTFNAVDTSSTHPDQTLVAGVGAVGLKLVANGATGPQITQNGAGGITLDLPLQLAANLTLGGNGAGVVTMNYAVTGVADIVKNGLSTFRFGTPYNSTTNPPTGPSANTWVGKLTINGGVIRFNNNAQAAPTALRSNPVVLSAGASLLFASKFDDQESSARMGTLSGSGGTVRARGVANAGSQDSLDIGIYAFSDGDFAGTLSNTKVGTQGINHKTGVLIVRGTGTQTLSGTLEIEKDVSVGGSVKLKLASTASLSSQTSGAIVLQGGTFTLDNATTNSITGRLRDGDSGSTGMDVIGGGTFSLIGNAAGTSETVSRLQLGAFSSSVAKPRSGALNVSVTHNAGAAAATVINFQSYARDQASNPCNTVNFAARSGAGAVLSLGQAGNNPRIIFNTTSGTAFTVPTMNGLLGNTGAGNTTTVGWATVNGTDFATYGVTNGIAAVPIDVTPAANGPGSTSSNVLVTANLTLTDGGGYNLNSLKLAPTSAGQVLDLAGGNLRTAAILLAGTTDFSITATGGGGIENAGATGPRYFHVQQAALTVGAYLGVVNAPVVKAGDGTLVLTNAGNIGLTEPLYINAGAVRATPGSSLPDGELRFRGGVLEITGGGTFARSIGFGAGNVTWSGIDGTFFTNISEERGSGGFAAVGLDASVDLNGAGASNLVWEDLGFVDSGFALILGSRNATNKVTFVDNINLTQTPPATPPALNYNAREIRVVDNAAVSTDFAQITGVIFGSTQNDLLKTGSGTLELAGANTFSGNTIIQEGVLSISAVANLGATSGANTVVLNGGTLRDTGAGVVLPATRTVALGTAGGTLDVTSLAALTVSGNISGTGATLTKTGPGTLTLSGAQNYAVLTTSAGTTNINGTFTAGTTTVNANATTNFGVSETLAALNIGAGAVVTLTATPSFEIAAAAVVPEPSALALAGGGLLLLGSRPRRRDTGKSQTRA